MSVAIVTGGAQGIGRGITAFLLKNGWTVSIVDRDVEGVKNAESFFADAMSMKKLQLHIGDVGKKSTAVDVVSKTVQEFSRLDLLVNNAGGGAFGVDFLDVTEEHWHSILDSNLSSAFFFSQVAMPHLEKVHGSIVNVASTRALQSEANTEAYSAAKGGVVSLTHAMAASLTGKVNVNCVLPGWIDVSSTEFGANREQIPISEEDKSQHFAGRIGSAEDIAKTVLHLHDSKFICGQSVVVDGGMSKKMIYK